MNSFRGRLYSRLPITIQKFGDYLRSDEVRRLRKPVIAGYHEVQPSDDSPECICGFHRHESFENHSISGLNLVFLWNALEGVRDSTLFRVFQSASRIASCFTGVRVAICPVQSRDLKKLQGATVVLHKNSGLSSSAIRRLRQSSNVVLTDYVDGEHSLYLDHEVDGFICCSATEYQWMQSHLNNRQKAYLVPHAPDDRLVGLAGSLKLDDFHCGYFGARENCLFSRELRSLELIDIVETRAVHEDTKFLDQKWVEDLRQTQFQFIARPSAQVWPGRFKPFTKGFLSAAMNQLVIGARFDAENRYWLGDDYPFLVEEENLSSAIAAIDFAKQSWKHGELDLAQATMERLRRVACPVQNALDYRDAFIHMSR